MATITVNDILGREIVQLGKRKLIPCTALGQTSIFVTNATPWIAAANATVVLFVQMEFSAIGAGAGIYNFGSSSVTGDFVASFSPKATPGMAYLTTASTGSYPNGTNFVMDVTNIGTGNVDVTAYGFVE